MMAESDIPSAISKWNEFYYSLTEGEKAELVKLAHQPVIENDEEVEINA